MTTFTGGSGADTFTGTAGDDIIYGLGGGDTLSGADGADYVEGGSGNDSLTGGAGADTFAYVARGFGDDAVTDFTAGDKVNLAALNLADLSQLQPFMQQVGLNTVITLGHGGNGEKITLNNVTLAGLTASSFVFNTSSTSLVVNGTSFGDVLFGGGGADQLYGMIGGDVLSGGTGADYLEGASGNDQLIGGAGNDTFAYVDRGFDDDAILDFTAGDKVNLAALNVADLTQLQPFMQQVGLHTVITLGYGNGSEKITLNNVTLAGLTASSFVFNTSSTSLVVNGTSFGDVLFGGVGADQLYGMIGGDVLSGGAGADYLEGASGNDQLIGGSGNDTFAYVARGFDDDAILDFTAGDKVNLAALNLADLGQLRPFMQQVGLHTVITLGYGSGSEKITLNNVTLAGLTASSFVFNTSSTNLVVNGTSFGDALFGGVGADQLYGMIGGDALSGGAGGDYLDGGADSDVLIGGGGGDSLTGGAGADTFLYTASSDSPSGAYDIITDFTTNLDDIDLRDVTPTEVSLITSGATTFVFVNTPGGAMTIAATGSVNGADVFVHDNHGFYMIGDGAANTLVGGSNGDVIQAGAGNDVIIGGRGGDVLFGEAGADTFRYQLATDSNAGGSDGIFVFQTGVDKIDLADVGVREISLIRSGGSTFLFASTLGGAMQLATIGYDLNGGDLLLGGANRGAYMIGDSVADVLVGSWLSDVIQAGDGADVITGSRAGDAIWGGAGADVFKYLSAADSTASAPGTDTIFDFQAGVDKIDLTGVRTGAGDAYGVAVSGGSTFIFVDLGGNGTGDMTIQLNGVAGLQNGDILF